jgi:hypothetical protein
MRYRLRTLLIVLAIGPPVLAWALAAAASSWPLFLAMGYVTCIIFAIAISIVIGRMLALAIDALWKRE